jgi:trigger factor
MSSQKREKNKEVKSAATGSEFKNDHITVLVEKQPGCQVKMDITVSPKASIAAYKKAIKSVNKEVSLPGFRKGKAPDAMITQNFSSYVDQEWREVLLQSAFKEAMTLTELYPLNEQSIKKPQIKKADKDNGAEIIIEFESAPNIPDISTENLKLKHVDKKEVSQDQIQESLENIRLHHAEWQDVENRAVKDGDYIDVDIQDDDHPERFICKDTRFEVAKGKMGDWMRKLVIGKKVHDTVTGMSERSPDLDPKADFKPTHCKITIKALKEAKLPEVNEELAKKLGVKSVEELQEKIEASLNTQADEEVQQQLREQMENLLLEKYSFEVPYSLIQRELKNRIDYLKRGMEKAGKSSSEVQEMTELSRSSVEEEVRKAFQLFFIARKIADENNIQVTQDELVRELMLQMYTQSSTLGTSLDPEEARSKVYITLLSQKVKDYLIKQAAVE